MTLRRDQRSPSVVVSSAFITPFSIARNLPKLSLLEEFNNHAPKDDQPLIAPFFPTKSIREYQQQLATFLGKYGSRARELSVAKVQNKRQQYSMSLIAAISQTRVVSS
jgi:hypothetical protein